MAREKKIVEIVDMVLVNHAEVGDIPLIYYQDKFYEAAFTLKLSQQVDVSSIKGVYFPSKKGMELLSVKDFAKKYKNVKALS
jgi:hypothetical protein